MISSVPLQADSTAPSRLYPEDIVQLGAGESSQRFATVVLTAAAEVEDDEDEIEIFAETEANAAARAWKTVDVAGHGGVVVYSVHGERLKFSPPSLPPAMRTGSVGTSGNVLLEMLLGEKPSGGSRRGGRGVGELWPSLCKKFSRSANKLGGKVRLVVDDTRVKLVDRPLAVGEIVASVEDAAAGPGATIRLGTVAHVATTLDVRVLSTGEVLRDIDAARVRRMLAVDSASDSPAVCCKTGRLGRPVDVAVDVYIRFDVDIGHPEAGGPAACCVLRSQRPSTCDLSSHTPRTAGEGQHWVDWERYNVQAWCDFEGLPAPFYPGQHVTASPQVWAEDAEWLVGGCRRPAPLDAVRSGSGRGGGKRGGGGRGNGKHGGGRGGGKGKQQQQQQQQRRKMRAPKMWKVGTVSKVVLTEVEIEWSNTPGADLSKEPFEWYSAGVVMAEPRLDAASVRDLVQDPDGDGGPRAEVLLLDSPILTRWAIGDVALIANARWVALFFCLPILLFLTNCCHLPVLS
jgi:hypothetical protein